jgi:hypothetical protein
LHPLHNGLANTSGRRRSNLYLNHIARDFNVMTYSPEHYAVTREFLNKHDRMLDMLFEPNTRS